MSRERRSEKTDKIFGKKAERALKVKKGDLEKKE